jgi:hypothetical protein
MAERRCISGKGGRKSGQQEKRAAGKAGSRKSGQQEKRAAGNTGSREYGESEPMRRVGVEYSDNSRESGAKAAGKARQSRKGAGKASKVMGRAEGIAGRAQIRAAIRPIHYQ